MENTCVHELVAIVLSFLGAVVPIRDASWDVIDYNTVGIF